MRERSRAVRCIESASPVRRKCLEAGGGVIGGGRIEGECSFTVGRVPDAGGVVKERRRTGGRVVAAGGVAIERKSADGGVVDSSCEVEEGKTSLGRVAVGIAAVWSWGNCARFRRQGKPSDGG